MYDWPLTCDQDLPQRSQDVPRPHVLHVAIHVTSYIPFFQCLSVAARTVEGKQSNKNRKDTKLLLFIISLSIFFCVNCFSGLSGSIRWNHLSSKNHWIGHIFKEKFYILYQMCSFAISVDDSWVLQNIQKSCSCQIWYCCTWEETIIQSRRATSHLTVVLG